MSRDSSRDRTRVIPYAPPARPQQQPPPALVDIWLEPRRSREVPALIDVTPTRVIPLQPMPYTQPTPLPQAKPRRRSRLLPLLAKPLELPFLMLRSVDWVIHFLLHTILAELFGGRPAPAARPANPQVYFPPAWPALEPLPTWRPVEPYERVREPSAFGDSHYLSGSRLTDYERLRQHAREYWDDIEAQDEEDFEDLFPGSNR